MDKVYTILIEEMAADGFPYRIDVQAFANKEAAECWVAKEKVKQQKDGFKMEKPDSDPDYWKFVKDDGLHEYVTHYYGQYREVIK